MILESETPVEFGDLEPRLKRYAAVHRLQVCWDALKSLPSTELTNFLAIQLPLDIAEKQAMVEARDVTMRADVLRKTLELGALTAVTTGATRH